MHSMICSSIVWYAIDHYCYRGGVQLRRRDQSNMYSDVTRRKGTIGVRVTRTRSCRQPHACARLSPKGTDAAQERINCTHTHMYYTYIYIYIYMFCISCINMIYQTHIICCFVSHICSIIVCQLHIYLALLWLPPLSLPLPQAGQRAHTHTHVCIYTHLCIYTHNIYIYIYIYVCMQRRKAMREEQQKQQQQ